jgi:hypothetical protein
MTLTQKMNVLFPNKDNHDLGNQVITMMPP